MYGEHFYERLEENLNRPGVTAALLSGCSRLARNIGEEEYADLSKHDAISPTHARILVLQRNGLILAELGGLAKLTALAV